MSIEVPCAGRTTARFARALSIAGGDPVLALAYCQGQRWSDGPEIARALKSLVDAVSMDDLVVGTLPIAVDFAAYLRPKTLLGQMTGLRFVPMNTRTLEGGGTRGAFVGEGMAVPVSSGSFSAGTTLGPKKASAIAVLTNELLRGSTPHGDMLIAADLAAGVTEAMDAALMDPANDGSGEAPASILNGATAVPSSGSTTAAIDADLKALLQTFYAAEIPLASPAFVMSRRTALHMALLRGSGGDASYPDIVRGQLLGVPVITSTSIQHSGSPGSAVLALVDCAEILVADEGRASVDASSQASLQVNDNPSDTAAQMTSMWANNCTAFKCTRWINWQRRRAHAASYISGITF